MLLGRSYAGGRGPSDQPARHTAPRTAMHTTGMRLMTPASSECGSNTRLGLSTGQAGTLGAGLCRYWPTPGARQLRTAPGTSSLGLARTAAVHDLGIIPRWLLEDLPGAVGEPVRVAGIPEPVDGAAIDRE